MLPVLVCSLLLATPALAVGHGYSFPIGRPQTCFNEGQKVELNFIKRNPCITCVCQGGTVICDHERCPQAEQCHLVLFGRQLQPGSCCEQCKGCQTPQGNYSEGEEWTDPDQPCQVNRCFSGIITRSRVKCYTPCSQPLPPAPGQCCPRCPKCQLAGHVIAAGQNLTSPEDPCTRCACHADGSQSCVTEVCPALSCPTSKTVRESGQCCRRCKAGIRRVEPEETGCQIGKAVYSDGSDFTLDPCTECVCRGGTAVCRRRSCPALSCPRRLQLHRPGRCCPVCRPPERVKRVCRHMRRQYKDGQTWKLNACTSCSCKNGDISCEAERCPSTEPTCPPGSTLTKVRGKCCKQCVEDDAVCTVFGDPHYNTFDGKLFNYQGTCKYLLAKDCEDRTFSVRVNNDPRKSRFFSWTRSATVKVQGLKISLRQKRRVKVNGEFVKLPYLSLGLVTIYQDPADNYNIVVKLTDIGVRVTWDGDSFLQVKIPPSYKKKMCGLCGNYNGKRSDDFTTRKGRVTRSVRRFGRSWRVGGRSHCAALGRRRSRRQRKRAQAACGGDRSRRAHAVRQCNRLKSAVFAPCHAKVHPASYFRSCVQDMCECEQKRSCYCEALTAYSYACRRRGVDVEWLAGTDCAAHRQCPRGAKYVACRSPCQPSCAAPTVPEACRSAELQCQPGCVCPEGTLLHRGICIPPQLCPNR